MKSTTRSLVRVIISLVYIVWGIMSPISAIKAAIALDISAIVTAIVGVLMLFAGFFGLLGIKRAKCRVCGVVIFLAAVLSVVVSLPAINFTSIVSAILAWLFIVALN